MRIETTRRTGFVVEVKRPLLASVEEGSRECAKMLYYAAEVDVGLVERGRALDLEQGCASEALEYLQLRVSHGALYV